MAKKISINFDARKVNLGDQFGLTRERSNELEEAAGKLVSATEAKNPIYLITEICALCENQQELAFCMVNIGYNRAKQVARIEARELAIRQAKEARQREAIQRESNKRPYDYIMKEARAAVVLAFTTNVEFNACVRAGLRAEVSVDVKFFPEEPIKRYSSRMRMYGWPDSLPFMQEVVKGIGKTPPAAPNPDVLKIKDAKIYINGSNYLGSAEEITLPKLKINHNHPIFGGMLGADHAWGEKTLPAQLSDATKNIVKNCLSPWHDDILHYHFSGETIAIRFKEGLSINYCHTVIKLITSLLQHRLPGGVVAK